MPRYKLIVEYDGTPFVGWQSQTNGLAVQDCLETAIERFCGETVRVQGAGRTDAGVHAMGQAADIELASPRPTETIMNAVNFHLKPNPIAVLSVEEVPDDFSARFSATGRHYLYRICNRKAPLTLMRDRCWFVPHPLDAEAMYRAAQAFVGKHDFTTFRSVHCQAKSPVRTLDRIVVARSGETIDITVSARSFLHNQVRSMVGSLKLVGDGSWPETGIAEALTATDRTACGPVAPACGLYLTGVDYNP